MPMTSTGLEIDRGLHSCMQPSLFSSGPVGGGGVDAGGVEAGFEPLDAYSSILFEPQWLSGSDVLFDRLRSEAPWRHVERPMYDRIVQVPRLICTLEIASLHASDPLRSVTRALESALGLAFETVGLNFYRTGRDSVAWHRDRVGSHRHDSIVALVSLGAPRTLAIRRVGAQHSKTAETTGITAVTRRRWRLGHGDLFVMTGACQRDWEHCVPKERHVGPRISLAFRSNEGS